MRVAQLYEYIKNHQSVYFNWVNFIVYVLYLNKVRYFLKNSSDTVEIKFGTAII